MKITVYDILEEGKTMKQLKQRIKKLSRSCNWLTVFAVAATACMIVSELRRSEMENRLDVAVKEIEHMKRPEGA